MYGLADAIKEDAHGAIAGRAGIRKRRGNKNVVIEYTGEAGPDLETVNKVLEPESHRRIGSAKDKIQISSDFDELPEGFEEHV